jgi:hypothetical protein
MRRTVAPLAAVCRGWGISGKTQTPSPVARQAAKEEGVQSLFRHPRAFQEVSPGLVATADVGASGPLP